MSVKDLSPCTFSPFSGVLPCSEANIDFFFPPLLLEAADPGSEFRFLQQCPLWVASTAREPLQLLATELAALFSILWEEFCTKEYVGLSFSEYFS